MESKDGGGWDFSFFSLPFGGALGRTPWPRGAVASGQRPAARIRHRCGQIQRSPAWICRLDMVATPGAAVEAAWGLLSDWVSCRPRCTC